MTIPFLDNIEALEKQPLQVLSYAPWKEFPYHPQVQFSIGYGANAIFLQYQVTEKQIRAVNSTPNSSVWEDSCVEFFIAFGNDKAYYNLEFNCIGAALVGYGEQKADRELLPDAIIRQIQFKATVTNSSWRLTLEIPFTVFQHHQMQSLQGQKARANFYKCGDLLPDPHFITWAPIDWPEPNFHLSQFFKPIEFIR